MRAHVVARFSPDALLLHCLRPVFRLPSQNGPRFVTLRPPIRLPNACLETITDQLATDMATDLRLKEQLPELTRQIVQTYSEVSTINHLGHCPLPNYDVIIACCEDLKEIIYPGFRRREGLHMGNVLYHVGDLIESLHDKLTVQIGRALRHDAGRDEMCTEDTRLRSPGPGQGDSVSGADSRDSRRCWRSTCRPPSTAIRPCKTLDEVIFCYPGPGSDHDLSPGPRPARAGRAVHSAHDDRMGPFARRASTFIPGARSASTSSSTTAPAW